ncbi:MAG: hypothetical protein WBS24_04175 [Terriglobales bacterium]
MPILQLLARTLLGVSVILPTVALAQTYRPSYLAGDLSADLLRGTDANTGSASSYEFSG